MTAPRVLIRHDGATCVQVHATNQAGSTTHFYSRPITVDPTPAVCNPPSFSPISGLPSDGIVLACEDGGRCDRGFYGTLTWISPLAAGFRYDVPLDVCADPESGTAAVELGVALRPGARNPSVAPYRFVAPPAEGAIHFPSSSLPLQGGFMHYVLTRCKNGAWISSFCEPKVGHLSPTAELTPTPGDRPHHIESGAEITWRIVLRSHRIRVGLM